MMKNDPMYASLFVANLGSVGLADAYHHLYEYGTVSVFGVMSFPRRTAFVEDGEVVVKEGLPVRWTFDERVNDGFYAANSLRIAQEVLEDPERHLGRPEATATG
jgi:pyruvate/2-oxoglutarate dehydrogenase complex dihydrolipoamide acyltransferase (E2) component